MRFPAIDFDREPLRLPIGVDLPSVDPGVEGGQALPLFFERLDKEKLGARAVEDGLSVEDKRLLQLRGTRNPSAAREDLVDRVKIEKALPLGAIHRALQLTFRLTCGNVKQRAGEGGDPEALPDLGVAVSDGHHPVDANTLAPTFAGEGHVDFGSTCGEEAP